MGKGVKNTVEGGLVGGGTGEEGSALRGGGGVLQKQRQISKTKFTTKGKQQS